MELTTYNPQKGRLETLEVEFTAENTTWFEYSRGTSVSTITDFKGGILIKKNELFLSRLAVRHIEGRYRLQQEKGKRAHAVACIKCLRGSGNASRPTGSFCFRCLSKILKGLFSSEVIKREL